MSNFLSCSARCLRSLQPRRWRRRSTITAATVRTAPFNQSGGRCDGRGPETFSATFEHPMRLTGLVITPEAAIRSP